MNTSTRVAKILRHPAAGLPTESRIFRSVENADPEALRTFFETAPQWVLGLRLGGGFLFANAVVRETLGISASDVSRISLQDFVPAGEPALASRWFTEPHSNGEWLPVRPTLRAGADKTIPLGGGVRLCQPPMDEPWLLAVLADVTELSATQHSLRECEDLLTLLTAHSPIGVFQMDAQGRLNRTNDRWRHIASLAHVAEPRGVWWQIVHPADRDRVVAQWESVQRHGYEFLGEFRVNARADEDRFVRTRITKIPNPRSSLTSYIGASEDITDHHRLEAQLRKAQDELEFRVRERTALLEAANAELLQFAYVVAHDLKAPLRAVSHLSGWLAKDHSNQLGVKGSEMMVLLQQRVRHMHDLIDGVLTYTQLGQVRKPDTQVDAQELVDQVIAMLAPPPHVRILVPERLPKVSGVPEQLYQVFQNLLDNAIKFSDKPKCVVTITAQRVEAAWEFSVADNGPGIPPRYRKVVFGLFQKLQHKENSEGTGIGLALVKRIATARGGDVTLNCPKGQGATFSFTWPDHPGPPRRPT